MKNIGVFTSGGDSPGMNACVRAVVRSAIYYGHKAYGIYRGYEGMIDGDIRPMDSASVSNIVQRGGTILRSARSERFRTAAGRAQAYEQLKKHNIDALVAIGGDGTFKGALAFNKEYPDVQIIGCPGTIDNDLYGTDFTIGYDTAINTAVEAIDKLRDTANSHDRLFLVEVMGRDAGFIALRSGIAGGAEAILVPETKTDINAIIQTLDKGWRSNKNSSIIVVAEGDESGGAEALAQAIKARHAHYEIRVTTLGHIQRGGTPTTMDRVLASQLGVGAVQALVAGKNLVMSGIQHKNVHFTPLSKATKHHQDISEELLNISKILSI